MDQKNIIILLIVAIVLVGGYFLLKPMTPTPVVQNPNQETNNTAQENNTTQNNTEISAGAEIINSKTYDVVYTDSGYSPSTLTIKVGDTVNFKNESSNGMWVGSAMHPSHTVYSGTTLQQHCPDSTNTSFDQCESSGPGTSWSFTFNKTGTWGQHNHVNAKHFSKIIVE